jgi:predicted transcriptional regulator
VTPKNPKRSDLNVRIPSDLMKKLKDYAWTVDKPLTKVVAEALAQFLADKKISPRPKSQD